MRLEHQSTSKVPAISLFQETGREVEMRTEFSVITKATREGVAAWQKLQACLRELAELNKERNLWRAREVDSA